MLFELVVVPLHCEDCDKETEHMVKFISYNPSTHLVKVECYCQECFDLAVELDLTYAVWEKELLFELYLSLHEKFGDPRF
jgi:hypothetical protein